MDTDGTVEFLEAYPPTLEAGNYQIAVSQTVAGAAAPYATTRSFTVAGPRFTLDPTLIHSLYPPPTQRGHFSKYLPQAVFTRKSLPWERSLDGTPPNPNTVASVQVTAGGSGYTSPPTVSLTGNGSGATAVAVVHNGAVVGVAVTCPGWNYTSAPTVAFAGGGGTGATATAALGEVFTPWLGILLFNENDPGRLPPVQTLTVSDLIAVADGGTRPATVLGPALTPDDLEPGQNLADKVMVIDVPAALFTAVAPLLGDLPFAAHARLIDPSKKVFPAAHNPDGWVSVAIGNRFPNPGSQNRAYIVSFEKFVTPPPSSVNYLAGAAVPSQYTAVRLVCLASWQFADVEEDENFEQLMENLNVWAQNGTPIGRLNLVPTTTASGGPTAAVQESLFQGFTAFNHTTRQGEKTASWDRGPLVPLVLAPADPQPIYFSSDAALKYDPATGLFDVSYAAAWQIGRLLGLNNRQFSTTLFAWRRAAHQTAATALTRHLLHARIGGAIPLAGTNVNPVPRQVVKDRVLAYLAAAVVPRLTAARALAGAAQPLLGEPADPSGLRRFADQLDGLLAPDEMARILADPGDPIEAIRRHLFG
jgi:hypothetical protein